ncbi:phosphoprotein [Alphacytorhabdovirus sambuci]|uniref:Phosphoprotein n=1 Tax=Sambucus cytorhabdovirus TaxID=2944624 RepID=A0AAE9KYS9_9RHAB|nr:phosphoprotein [Sambucus cytorhabdovirus]UQU68819.1 phosphoprotein [Sambucus cytorhabdovirus]UQU68825.1 phosphoprotein [Sambucus cytorhabdovirus]
MSNGDENEFKGAFTPSRQTDFVAMANDDDRTMDDLPGDGDKVPLSGAQVVDPPKLVSVGDVKQTLGHLKHSAVVHGAVVDSNMESLFKHYCITEKVDARDVELWVRGYVYSTGSQIGPRITEVTEVLKNEIRSLQRTNAALLDTVKLLANQAVAVEKEIASVTVNIKTDIAAALKSALDGQAKVYERTKDPVKMKAIPVPIPDLKKPVEPKKVPEALSQGAPKDPSTSSFSDGAQFAKMRAVMKTIGVEQQVLDYITDDELPVVYPEEELREYMNQLHDPEIRALFLEEINKNIEERLLSG